MRQKYTVVSHLGLVPAVAVIAVVVAFVGVAAAVAVVEAVAFAVADRVVLQPCHQVLRAG